MLKMYYLCVTKIIHRRRRRRRQQYNYLVERWCSGREFYERIFGRSRFTTLRPRVVTPVFVCVYVSACVNNSLLLIYYNPFYMCGARGDLGSRAVYRDKKSTVSVQQFTLQLIVYWLTNHTFQFTRFICFLIFFTIFIFVRIRSMEKVFRSEIRRLRPTAVTDHWATAAAAHEFSTGDTIIIYAQRDERR